MFYHDVAHINLESIFEKKIITLITCNVMLIIWFGLMLYVTVNNFSVMFGRSHRFLGTTSTFFVCEEGGGGKYVLLKE